MKKLLSATLAVLMITSLFAGCGEKATNSNSTASTTSTSASTDGEKQEKPLKIAYLANGSTSDKSFFESALTGVKAVKEKYGCEVTTKEIGTDATKWEPALMDASDGDYDIIIIGTYSLEDAVKKVAPQYPDKKYIMFDFSMDFKAANLSNVYCMTYKAYEGAYLSGALAAMMSKVNKIGFVGGMDIPLINDFMVGYVQGAQSVNKDIKVLISYVGDFNDPAKGKELALAQYNQGADVIYQGCGQSGLGCLDAAKEKGKFIIGTDSDQAMLYKTADPVKANLILTCQLKRVDNTVVRAIELYKKGDLEFGTTQTLGLAEGAISLADNEFYQKLVPQDVRTKVSELQKKIVSGAITIKSGLNMSTDEINKIRNSVKP